MSAQQSVKLAAPAAPKKPRGRPKKQATVTLPTAAVVQPLAQMTTTIQVNNLLAQAASSSTLLAQAASSLTSLAQATSSSTLTSHGMVYQLHPSITGFTSMLPNTPTATPFTPPTVTATTPTPPNWLENCEDTTMSLLHFKKFPISRTSAEYQAITNMLHPLEIQDIQQIVNPDLWKRFVHTRKEMLRSKSDDLNILSKIGMDENELMRCAHFALNFSTDPMMLPYSDNMALLFHCTRSKSSLDNILSQGLDERLSNMGGLLGKGIYFADNPMKSLQYDGTGHILIFAVLLGDCISVDHWTNKHLLVREPEKVKRQKRNINDLFFDSIVARPAGFNEYVIYNRYQCCPLYQIAYKRSTQNSLLSKSLIDAQQLPPITWIPQVATNSCAMPVPLEKSKHWPFFAVELFEKMGAVPPTDENMPPIDGNVGKSVDEKLATMVDFGFQDESKNKEMLSKFNNNVDEALNYLLSLDNSLMVDEENQPELATTSNAPTTKENPKLLPMVTIDLVSDSEVSD